MTREPQVGEVCIFGAGDGAQTLVSLYVGGNECQLAGVSAPLPASPPGWVCVTCTEVDVYFGAGKTSATGKLFLSMPDESARHATARVTDGVAEVLGNGERWYPITGDVQAVTARNIIVHVKNVHLALDSMTRGAPHYVANEV